jgi:tetratricopeptide (TPR) repeat protein
LKNRDDVIRYDHIVANLVTALDIGGREAEAEQILDQGLVKAPKSSPLLRRYAQLMAFRGDWKAALKALDAVPAADLEPPDEILRAVGHLRSGSADQALTEARDLQEKFGSTRFAESAAGLRLEAAAVLGSLHTELDATLTVSPASIAVRSVGVGLLNEDDPRRATLVAEIDGLVAKITNPQDRFHAAEALFAAKQYAKAADLYASLHGRDSDNPALRRHLAALNLADHRQEVRQLFENLSEAVKSLPYYAQAGAAIYERSGLLPECRKIVENYLLGTGDLLRRLQWISLCERLGDTQPVIDWLRIVPPQQQGRPRDLITLALRIDRLLGDPKCLPIAYRALRNGYDDPQVHLGYTYGLIFAGRVSHTAVDSPTQVGPDTAVTLNGDDGRQLIRVIETEPNPNIERDEVAPSDTLATRLIGLKVGDAIQINNIGVGPSKYVVSTIHNKYLHAHLRSLERFRTMFPESQDFGSFTIDESKGDEKFKPIFDLAKNRAEQAGQVMDFYRRGRLPLATAARLGGRNGFEFWDAVWGNPDARFNVAVGSPDNYQAAQRLLSENRGAVVDPITLYGLVKLKVADKVRAAFDGLAVVQTTIDLLRWVVQEREHARVTGQGRFGWDGEHFVMIKLGPEAIEERIAEAQEVLAFSESLTLLPAEAAGEINDETHFFGDLDDAYLDTVLAARGNGRLLLCDDFPFRVLSEQLAGINSVWTQAALAAALGRRVVTADEYLDVVNTLAVAGYFFTSISAENFLLVLRKNGWSIDGTIQTLANLLAHPANNPVPILNILRHLIRFVWVEKPNIEAFESLFITIFSAFKNEQPKCDLIALIEVVTAELVQLLWRGWLVIQKTQIEERLLNSTSIVPVDVVLAGPLEAVRAVAQEITEVLSGALRKAGNNKLQPAAQTGLTPDRRARRDARRGSRRRNRRRWNQGE